jgi:hypothetical protein
MGACAICRTGQLSEQRILPPDEEPELDYHEWTSYPIAGTSSAGYFRSTFISLIELSQIVSDQVASFYSGNTDVPDEVVIGLYGRLQGWHQSLQWFMSTEWNRLPHNLTLQYVNLLLFPVPNILC